MVLLLGQAVQSAPNPLYDRLGQVSEGDFFANKSRLKQKLALKLIEAMA
jgi:hypothetical protein